MCTIESIDKKLYNKLPKYVQKLTTWITAMRCFDYAEGRKHWYWSYTLVVESEKYGEAMIVEETWADLMYHVRVFLEDGTRL